MNTLVIVPSLHHKFSFSAPLAWMFSSHVNHVRGIYSFELKPRDLKGVELCVIELNWFIELYEFMQIVRFIKRCNKKSKVLFGGLYAQLMYKRIFKENDVDYFIKGFSEKPMKMLLDGVEPRSIPNLVGRDFENETTYVFRGEDYKDVEYNLDWFPDYFKYWALFPEPDQDIPADFSWMPFLPTYHYPKKIKDPAKTFRVPPQGGRYHLPMVITARGGCSAVHDGCDYCMGAKHEFYREMYQGDMVVMDNNTLKQELNKIAAKFDQATLYINSNFVYDFTGEYYPLDITIEVDCKVTLQQLARVINAFRKATVHMVLYEDGHHTCHSTNTQPHLDDFLALQDETHKIYFFAFKEDADRVNLPEKNRLYAEYVFPRWASWEYYNDFDKAVAFSKKWFSVTRQYNLFPLPRRLIMRPLVFVILFVVALASRLGLVKPNEEMFFGDRV